MRIIWYPKVRKASSQDQAEDKGYRDLFRHLTGQEETPSDQEVIPPFVGLGKAEEVLQGYPDGSIDLIYTDPPFNTGKVRKGKVGSFPDSLGKGYWPMMTSVLKQFHRLLKPTGSLYIHLDYREVHNFRHFLDEIFGPENFMNEIIWAYDYGARSKTRWPAKHDNILFYVKDHRKGYTFNYESMDRMPYMAPSLVGKEKAEKGKTPTDVWWHTIVHTTGPERTGYPTQKPLFLAERIIKVSSNPGDVVLDPFCGSGTTGVAAVSLGRTCVLYDSNPQAVEVSKGRIKLALEEKSAQRLPLGRDSKTLRSK